MIHFLHKNKLYLLALLIVLASVAAILLWPRADALFRVPPSTRESAISSLPVTVADPDARLVKAQKENPDIVAWLTIPGTNIDTSVQQSDDNEYYLRRNASGEYDEFGCVYADYDCDLTATASLPRNLVLYGHTFDAERENSFGELHNYDSYVFSKEHLYFYISLSDAMLTYQLVSAGLCPAASDYDCIDTAPNDTEFRTILDKAFARCAFDYNTSVEKSDKILTLSTCTDDPDVRYLVVAKLIDYVEVQ